MKLSIISLIYNNNFEKSYTQQLIRESSFITEHLVRGLYNYDVFNCRRINFICNAPTQRPDVRKFGKISEMDVSFNPEYFFMSSEKKRIYLYDLLYFSLLDLCRLEQWDFSPIQSLFQELKNNNYSSKFYSKLYCKHNGIVVKLLGIQQMDKVMFYLEFNHKNSKPIVEYFFSSKPNVFDYDRFLGGLEWKDTNEIVLTGKDNSKKIFTNPELIATVCAETRNNS